MEAGEAVEEQVYWEPFPYSYTYYVPNNVFLALLRAPPTRPRPPVRIVEACVPPPAARAARCAALLDNAAPCSFRTGDGGSGEGGGGGGGGAEGAEGALLIHMN